MKTENELNIQLELYQKLLNTTIEDQSKPLNYHDFNDQKSIFMMMMIEYLNNNFSQFKYAMMEEVDCFMKKTEFTKNFLLNTINKDYLKMTIEEIIMSLESLSPLITQRKCFSFNNNPVNEDKLLIDLSKVVNQLSVEQKEQSYLDIPRVTSDSNLGLSIEKHKDINTISLNKTPTFGKPHSTKMFTIKGGIQSKDNKRAMATLFHSPSPVILNKTRSKYEKKKTQETPERNDKKKFWLY